MPYRPTKWLDNTVPDLLRRVQASGRSAVIIVGAGASFPYPTAHDVKARLVAALLDVLPTASAFKTELDQRIREPFLTLELLVQLFQQVLGRAFDVGAVAATMLSGLEVSQGSLAIGLLREAGLVGPIVTTNFDSLIMSTLTALSLDFKVKTDLQFRELAGSGPRSRVPSELDVVCLHGTLAQAPAGETYTTPTTFNARGLMRPFRVETAEYLEELLKLATDRAAGGQARPIILFGYSGNDHYDINPILAQFRDRIVPGGLHWIVHEGREDGISNFAGSLTPTFYDCNFAEEVLSFLVPRRPAGAAPLPTVTGAYTSKPFRISPSRRANFEVQAFRLINRIRSRAMAAWAVTEHYTLESYGFEQSQIAALGRPMSSAGAGGAPIFFSGIDVTRLIDAQEAYWAENIPDGMASRWAGIPAGSPVSKQIGDLFPRSSELFRQLLFDVEARLRDNGVTSLAALAFPTVLDVDELAMLLTFQAIACDYLGLMANKVRTLTGSPAECQVASDLACGLFSLTTSLARTARMMDGSALASDSRAVRVANPALIWEYIGRENHARALRDDVAVSARQIAHKARSLYRTGAARQGLVARLGDSSDEALYFLPQIAIQQSQAVKVAYRCSGIVDVPSRDVSSSLKATALRALNAAEQCFKSFQRASALVNYRFATVFDCRGIVAVAERDFDALPDIAAAANHYFGTQKTLGRSKIFLTGIARRWRAIAAAEEDPAVARRVTAAAAMIQPPP